MRCTWPQHCCARRVLKLSSLLSGLCWFVPFDGFFSSFPIICLYRCSGVSLPLLELCVLCRAGRVWLRKRGWGCVFTRAVRQARAVLAVAERSSITFSVACSCMFLWCGDAVKNGEKKTPYLIYGSSSCSDQVKALWNLSLQGHAIASINPSSS